MIHYQMIPSTDPRLNRHIRHDDRSKLYPFDTTGLTVVSAKHTRRVPVFDQGQLGSCTGNGGLGCAGTDPFFATITGEPHYPWNETGAVSLYSDATRLDSYPGQYPPTDTGSDGLAVAQALKAAGMISGYQHTFTLTDALKALTVTPVICGVTWYDTMSNPDPDGRVYPTGTVAGGHEICADEINAELQQVWFTNSWGTGWGVQGRCYLSFDDFGKLLADNGDVTIFVPLSQPAPTPTPVPVPPAPVPGDPDAALAAAMRHNDWIHHHHVGDNAHVAKAGATWLAAHNL